MSLKRTCGTPNQPRQALDRPSFLAAGMVGNTTLKPLYAGTLRAEGPAWNGVGSPEEIQ